MQPKYDTIGIDYDLTRKADPYLVNKFLEHLAPFKEGLYLDVGCGTGNYTSKLCEQGYRFIGIDPSLEMLQKAQQRNSDIDWRLGSVENLELKDNSVDGVIASLTLHHWGNLDRGFAELCRVLKPSGRIVIFTSTPEQMKGYWLNKYFPKMMAESTAQMPDLERVVETLKVAGVELIKTEGYSVRTDLEDQFLQCGKENPELYFDEQIRKGISSFAALANETEVEQGLQKLRKDIDSGEINRVITSYENNLGDYLYIIGEKFNSPNR